MQRCQLRGRPLGGGIECNRSEVAYIEWFYHAHRVSKWWQPDTSGDEWKDDESKVRESIAFVKDCLRGIIRLLPREELLKSRQSAYKEYREWIDQELALRGPEGKPRPFQGLGE